MRRMNMHPTDGRGSAVDVHDTEMGSTGRDAEAPVVVVLWMAMLPTQGV